MIQKRLFDYQGSDTECPTCGRGDFDSPKAVKIHHAQTHNRSLAGVLIVCDWCGETKKKRSREFDKTELDFCDHDCYGAWESANNTGENNPKWKGGPVVVECAWCGRTKEVSHYYGNNGERHFCNQQCNGRYKEEHLSGENHPMHGMTGQDNPLWKGGHTLYFSLLSQLPGGSWDTVRSRVREKYDHVCQMCGVKRHGLQVHHIIPLMSGGINTDEMLMPLCNSCHAKTESYTRKLPGVSPLLSVK